MFSKNDEVDILIEDISNEGEGIGHVNGYALFVKDTLPGDYVHAKIIKVKKSYGFARLMDIIKPSEDRTEAVCENAVRCGGCQLQHYRYDRQLDYKQNKVKNALVRMGGFAADFIDSVMEPVIGMDNPYNYRNKAQFPVGKDKEGNTVIGFYAGRTHSIIDSRYCYIQSEVSNKVVSIIRSWIERYGISPYEETKHSGLIRHILVRNGFKTGEVMVCLVVTSKKVPALDKLVELLGDIDGLVSVCLNINKDKTNKILGDKIINVYGRDYIEDYIGDVKYRISPLSFYQVNPVQTEKLYSTALDFAGLTGNETVWDLYCGIGTISLFLAKSAKSVLGVEIVPQAISDAKVNAQINNIDNALFTCGAAEDVEDFLTENELQHIYGNPDVIVVDPPRKGCDSKLLDTIISHSPERIVYVSCDPATLARDLKILCEDVYEIKRVRACDMFGMSGHVETVVLLSHKKADSYIHIDVEFGEGEGKIPVDSIAKRAEAYKPKEKVTYKMIKEYIEAKYGFKVHTAYIAEVKRDLGLPMYDAPNAVEELKQPRKHPTPEKVEAIKDALRYFAVI